MPTISNFTGDRSLQPPAGDEATPVSDDGDTSLVSDGSSDPVDTSSDLGTPVDDPGTDPPANNYTDGPKKVPPVDNGGDEDGPAMTATVVGADDAGYAIADKSGNLLYVHYPNPVSTEPAVGKKIGLAFQIVDDVLDEEGDAATLGKTAGKDKAQQKMTYPAAIGLEASKKEADRLIDEAIESIRAIDRRGELTALARFICSRVN